MTTPPPRSAAAREALEKRLAGLSPAKRALMLREAGFDPAPALVSDAPAAAPAGPVRLSFGQEVLWLVEQASPEQSVYNVPTAVRVRGAFDVAAFERALAALIARHKVLASRVQLVDGTLSLVEDARAAVPLERGDMLGASDDARRAWVTALVRRPFDLARDLPIRAAVAREDADSNLVVLVLHHLVSDGWSRGLLFDELSALYREAATGTPAGLAPLALQYRDFAHWQRERLTGDRLASLLAFWSQQLPSGSEATSLPYDRAPGPGRSFAGARVARPVDPALGPAVRAFATESGTSLFVVMLTAFQTLLQRYAGGTDVVVASPVAGRSRPEWEALIGYFSNTLLFRATFDDAPTFRTLLARGRAAALSVFDHDELPFERLVMDLPPEQRRADGAFFGAMFAMAGGEGKSLRFGDAEVAPFGGASSGARADLYVAVVDRPEGLRLSAEFRKDLFDNATVERMLAHLEVLLAAAIANPDLPVSALPLLPEEERRQVLTAWQGATLALPTEPTLHALVAAQAARTPTATALVHGTTEITYAELVARAGRVAGHLAALGVGPDVRVGICLNRTNDLVVAILGVLMAGGAYVPLDPAYPPDRNALMLEDSAAGVVLTEPSLAASLAGRAPHVCLVADLVNGPPPVPAPTLKAAGASNLAYQIYTSGSTGRPKGVMLEHRNAIALVAWARTLFSPDDVAGMLFSTSVCFDLSVFELFLTLSSGGTLIIADNAIALPTLPAANRVTFLNTVPSAAAALIRLRGIPANVRTAVLCGEPLPTATVNDLYALGHITRVYDMYGPTEDTVYSTCALRAAGAPPTIGRPIANSTAYVLDPSGTPTPIGIPGELVLGGAGVARGYHGREDLTAEKFVRDPFAGADGARMYRTGDRVRWRADGMLDFLGRLDHQVKIRGFRIEPGEVQVVLEGLPGVAEAAVIVRPDANGEKQLLGYVVVAAGADPAAVSDAGLRAGLRQQLPEFMVPAVLTRLEAMPRTPNGKLDRAALPNPDAAPVAREMVAPRTETETLIAGYWSEVLRAPLGVTENVFTVGGHSLLGLRVLARIADQCGVRLPMRALFEHPTVESLAARVDAERAQGGSITEAPIPRRASIDAPLSPAQELLWRLQLAEPESNLYNVPSRRRVRGPLVRAALETALNGLVHRHEVLRSTFHEAAPVPVQRPGTAPVALIWRAFSGEWAEADAQLWLDAEARRPFHLETEPPFRAAVAELGAEEHVLLLVAHHLAFDAWSFGVVSRDLATLYAAAVRGAPGALPPLAIQFGDVAAWLRNRADSGAIDRQVAYWRDALAGATRITELPAPATALTGERFAGRRLVRVLPAAIREGVERIARETGASVYHVLLAGYASLLHRVSAQDDVVMGSVMLGRDRREVEPLVGYLSNTLPVRAVFTPGLSFRDLVTQMRETALRAAEHGEVPFERLVEEVAGNDGVLFNVALVLQPKGGAPLALGDATAEAIATDAVSAKFDLLLSLTELRDGLRASAEFRTDRLSAATVQRLLAHFEVLMRSAVDDPGREVANLPLLDDAEARVVLQQWSVEGVARPIGGSVVDEVGRQVAKSPTAIAVRFAEETLTYAELGARSDALARYLVSLGAGRDQVVGIAMERSIAMVVAVLAVLKSGSAYAPIDPEYPAERVQGMLEDAKVQLVCTTPSVAQRIPALEAARCVWAEDAPPAAPDVPLPVPGLDDLAYVIFTSGSTGRPKGVAMPHRPLANLIAWQQRESVAGPGDATLQFASLSFDVSFQELFATWTTGGTLVLVDELTRRDPPSLVRLIDERAIRRIFMPYIALQSLAEAGLEAPTFPRALTEIITAGEQLQVTPAIVEWMGRRPGSVLYNQYGPSETHVVTQLALRGDPRQWPSVPSIGRAITNARTYVLDRNRQPLPAGIVGELWLGGDAIARGYIGRDDLTAERFVPDPYAGVAGARMYKSGDLARWSDEGDIEFLGRADHQVKVRGFRIELGEVEAVVAMHPDVGACVVTAPADARGLRRLVAYAVPQGGADRAALPQAVRQWCQARLPEYMVPAIVMLLDALPKTPSGKIDRKALPEPEATSATAFVAPRTDTERAVAQAFSEVLKAPQVGRDDDFFALGGHSLVALRVVAKLRESLGRTVAMRLILESPQVAALAAAIDASAPAAPTPASRITAASREGLRRTRPPRA